MGGPPLCWSWSLRTSPSLSISLALFVSVSACVCMSVRVCVRLCEGCVSGEPSSSAGSLSFESVVKYPSDRVA